MLRRQFVQNRQGLPPRPHVRVFAQRFLAHVATVPLKVIKQLAKHPLTDIGLAQFLADAKKIPS